MATSSILHWVTRRSRSSNTRSAESMNDQGPHQSNVAGERSENTVVNGGQPSEAALPTSSEPASASTVSQSTSVDSATHGEMLVVGSQQVQPELISDSANQPVLQFPMRSFGKQQRAFRSSWYTQYPWLHYQEGNDSVLCFHCMVARKRGLLHGTGDAVFSRIGFSNWKKALEKFEKHQKSNYHRDAVQLITSNTKNVGEMLSESYAQQKVENRQVFMIILSSIRFLARQGLALRGHYKAVDGDESGAKGEPDSNFLQLLQTRAEDHPNLSKWLKKSQDKFTSPDVQNEILSVMAMHILRDISTEISGKWYALMVDETTDLSNTEQMVVCLRYVDDSLEVHEEFVGLYSLESTSADVLVTVIQDTLLRMNLAISNCRGQCYDGSKNMSGSRSGVATRITNLESRAPYTHRYGHALNLAIQDTVKGVKVMEDTLDTVYEITKLIKKSPKRDVIFQKFKNDVASGSPGIRILCPTRWTVRAEALTSISENYSVLQLTWKAAKEATKNTEMRARVLGVAAQMEKFSFFFGIELGRKVLNMADNLSRSLQSATMSACEGQKIVKTTLATYATIRTDECFDLFWDYLESRRSSVDVSSPVLPRRRKVPRRFEVGTGVSENLDTPKYHYKKIYFEVVDLVMATIKDRFEQRGFHMLAKLERVVTTKEPAQADIEDITSFYSTDFSSADRLQVQLNALQTAATSSEIRLTDIQSVVAFLKRLNSVELAFFSEVVKVVKLILVMPATNAVGERSFSALRRLKTWLRTTMQQHRLNWCMLLHVHKDRTDNLPMRSIANEFAMRNDSRMRIFGHF